MLRYLARTEKGLCRELWEEAFPEDSQSFDDYYFSEKLKENRILVRTEDGQIAAMLHRNPYRIYIRGQRQSCDYIVGVATRQDKRHRGYMRQLLERVFQDMTEEQMPFCFLMPADPAIYQPFDFVYIFDQPQWQLKPDADGLERRSLLPWKNSFGGRGYLAEIAAWMNRWLANRYQVYGVRDETYMSSLLKELASEAGTLDILYDGGTMVGIHSEWGLGDRKQRMLLCEPQYCVEGAPAKPAIMARIVDLQQFVRAIGLTGEAAARQQEVTIVLEVKDSLIPKNDGLWNWCLSQETSYLELVDVAEAGLTEADMRAAELATTQAPVREPRALRDGRLSLSISELTAWLFGYEVPEAARPYAQIVKPLQGVFLDEVV